jgi:nucleotide-binding universal stress UspA family protein
MPAPIIAAYDPNRQDHAPVELALALAELADTNVIAAVVDPSRWTEGWSEEDGNATAAAEELRERYDGIETRVLERLSVPNALHKLARELEAGLIVVGSTNRGLVGRVLVGSTAEQVMHGAPCPVAIAPHGYAPAPIKTIVVGFVDSAEGRAALAAAHALATRGDARLRVVTALHPTGGLDMLRTDGGLRPPRGAALEGRHRSEAEAAQQAAIEALGPGAKAEPELHVDDAAELLARVSTNVDLLVCGSRGYGPLRSVLLGGVSRRLMDEAECPVIVLPRAATQPLEELLGAPAIS